MKQQDSREPAEESFDEQIPASALLFPIQTIERSQRALWPLLHASRLISNQRKVFDSEQCASTPFFFNHFGVLLHFMGCSGGIRQNIPAKKERFIVKLRKYMCK